MRYRHFIVDSPSEIATPHTRNGTARHEPHLNTIDVIHIIRPLSRKFPLSLTVQFLSWKLLSLSQLPNPELRRDLSGRSIPRVSTPPQIRSAKGGR